MNTSLRVHVPTRAVARSTNLPTELFVAVCFGAVWLAGVLARLPINIPTIGEAPLLAVHFFFPILLGSVVDLLVVSAWCCARARDGGYSTDPLLMLKLFPLVVLSVFLYFNFKAWMPLVSPWLYDAQLEQIDLRAAPIVDAMRAARAGVAAWLPFEVDSWYSVLFFAMFFMSLSVHAVVDSSRRQRQLVLGMCLNLLIGGLGYWVAPAEGPFLYRHGANVLANAAQQAMHLMFAQVRATGQLPPGYFTAPLGAMPSLHVAHALLFTIFAARSARFLLPVYVPLLLWIVIEASASGWHYLIDLPAGAALALVSFVLATRLIGDAAPVA